MVLVVTRRFHIPTADRRVFELLCVFGLAFKIDLLTNCLTLRFNFRDFVAFTRHQAWTGAVDHAARITTKLLHFDFKRGLLSPRPAEEIPQVSSWKMNFGILDQTSVLVDFEENRIHTDDTSEIELGPV